MKTKYFSNSSNETLDDLQANVNKWIASHKNIRVIEMKTSAPSKTNPPEFFIRMDYDDKMPPRVPTIGATPGAEETCLILHKPVILFWILVFVFTVNL